MESADPLSHGFPAAGVRGARIAYAGWALWLIVLWAGVVAGALFLVWSHRPQSDVEAYFRLYTNVSWGAAAAAELVVAAALVPLARALADRRARLLLGIACGALAGGALLTALAIAAPLPRPLGYLVQGLHAAGPASFVWASARVLRSDDARVSRTLLGAALFALVAHAGEAWILAQASPAPSLQWLVRELDLLAAALPVASAYLVARHARRASADIDPRRARDPYRVAEPSEEDTPSRERLREGRAAADHLGIHSGAVCVYGATAAAGILLSAYQEKWHLFYAQAEVIVFTSSVGVAALFVMAAAIPRHRAAGLGSGATFPGRGSTVLALALEVAAYAMMLSLSQPFAPAAGTWDDFGKRLSDRDARFDTAAWIAFLGSVLALVAIARLAVSFKHLAASAHRPALARRAAQIAILVGVLAVSLVGVTVLAENGPYEVMAIFGSVKRSPVAQGALAVVVLVLTAGHALTARGAAEILEGGQHGQPLAPERQVAGDQA
ncbi:MAG: hypothetical protein QM820_09180 [Minicystis sp.]